jgi:hypothetical protein
MAVNLQTIRDGGIDSVPLDELTPREQPLVVKYNDPEGKSHTASVLSRILDGDERIQLNRAAAQLAGMAWDMMPTGQQARVWALATIALQLRNTPDWLSRWAPQDDTLLFSLFAECQAHDRNFFRTGGGEGKTNAGEARVSVTAIDATSTPA